MRPARRRARCAERALQLGALVSVFTLAPDPGAFGGSIHGRNVSIGCVAIGDAGIEDLYLLLAEVGLRHARVLLAPSADPRPEPGAPDWVPDLYTRLRRELLAVRGPLGLDEGNRVEVVAG